MKSFNFLSFSAILVLVVTLASCGLTQPGYGDEEYSDRPVRSRQIYSDPYYSNSRIVRDPYTGQYYEVTPVSPYGYETYGYPAGSYGNNRNYGRRSSGGYSTNYPSRTQSTQQSNTTQEQNRGSGTTNKAKSIIRGDQ